MSMKKVVFIIVVLTTSAVCYMVYERTIKKKPTLLKKEVSRDNMDMGDRPSVQREPSPLVVADNNDDLKEAGRGKEGREGAENDASNDFPARSASPSADKKPSMSKMLKDLSVEDLAELEKYYETIEGNWMVSIKDLIVKKLSLDPQYFQDYLKIRSDFQKERAVTFREFHENMMIQHGEGHTYNPTEYEKEIGESIQEKYFEQLRNKLGDDTFSHYMRYLNKYNEKIIQEQDSYKGLLKIHF